MFNFVRHMSNTKNPLSNLRWKTHPLRVNHMKNMPQHELSRRRLAPALRPRRKKESSPEKKDHDSDNEKSNPPSEKNDHNSDCEKSNPPSSNEDDSQDELEWNHLVLMKPSVMMVLCFATCQWHSIGQSISFPLVKTLGGYRCFDA